MSNKIPIRFSLILVFVCGILTGFTLNYANEVQGTVLRTLEEAHDDEGFYTSPKKRQMFSRRWAQAIKEADEMLSKENSDTIMPSCLIPNKHATMELVQQQLLAHQQSSQSDQTTMTQPPPLVPLPIMNLGMPKTGSTTLFEFLTCAGLRGTHQILGSHVLSGHKSPITFEGVCMRDAVNNGLPPIGTCAPNEQFMMQMDSEFPLGFGTRTFVANEHRDECYFPQLELLEEFHREVPNATFIMNFRPIEHWIHSMRKWYGMFARFRVCNLPNKPRGIPQNITDDAEFTIELKRFLCSHVLHFRQFVQDHPSHKLIELDLYDTNTSSYVMSTLFPNSQTMDPPFWQHANQNPQSTN